MHGTLFTETKARERKGNRNKEERKRDIERNIKWRSSEKEGEREGIDDRERRVKRDRGIRDRGKARPDRNKREKQNEERWGEGDIIQRERSQG